MWHRFFSKIIKTLDPKLDKYREPITTTPKPSIPKYTPQTLEDFIAVIKRTPHNILSSKDRDRIAAVMNFDNRTVGDLMISKKDMLFVHSDEVLGPLVLDKLYKSGVTNFPVIDHKEKVIGILHTEALNTLEIKKTDRATKYINKNIHYLHFADSLNFAIEESNRLGNYYFLVQDDHGHLIGFFTIQLLLDYLLN